MISINDLILCCSRTGRAGKRGVVTSFITKHDAAMARVISDSKMTRKPITSMSSGSSTLTKYKPQSEVKDDTSVKTKSIQRARGRGTNKLKTHKIRSLRYR